MRAQMCLCFLRGVSLRAQTCVSKIDDRSLRLIRGVLVVIGLVEGTAIKLQKSVPPYLDEQARLRTQTCVFWEKLKNSGIGLQDLKALP